MNKVIPRVIELITRKEAQAAGLPHYFTGKPCLRGHVCVREVNSRRCIDCLCVYARNDWEENGEVRRKSQRRRQNQRWREDPEFRAKKGKDTSDWQKRDLRTPEGWSKRAQKRAKKRAAKIGVPFSISVQDVLNEWNRAGGVCSVLGISLVPGADGGSWNSPSLDRIIPSRGYVPGNIRVISTRANLVLNNSTALEIVRAAQDRIRAIAQRVENPEIAGRLREAARLVAEAEQILPRSEGEDDDDS